MNYEYAPRFQKKKEKLLSYALIGLAAALIAVSYVPGVPYPGYIQLLGMGAIVAMIMIYSMCVAHHYSYRIEECEGAAPDFVITEYYGRRVSVVCRVSVASVMSATPWNGETKKRFDGQKKGTPSYTYTGVLFDEAQYVLDIEEGQTRFFVRICADDTLIRLLINH